MTIGGAIGYEIKPALSSSVLRWRGPATDTEAASLDTFTVRRRITAQAPPRPGTVRHTAPVTPFGPAHRLARTAIAQQCAQGDVHLHVGSTPSL